MRSASEKALKALAKPPPGIDKARDRRDARRIAIERQRAGRIQIEVLLGHDERIVRPMETGPDEPRLAGRRLTLDGPDRVGRVLPVGLVVIVPLHAARAAPGQLAAGQIADLTLVSAGVGWNVSDSSQDLPRSIQRALASGSPPPPR